MWTEFKTFLIKDNVIGLAIAVILGVALNAVVNSVVNDVIMPVVNLATAATGGNWQNWRIWLTSRHEEGAPAILIGRLFANLLNFFIIGFVVWRISKIFVKPKATVPA
jgi:large conductance mechanosensitive channel